MRKILFVVLALLLVGLDANAATKLNPYTGKFDFIELPPVTVATLPAAANATNQAYIVTDGSAVGDCTTGGGNARNICISNGSAWVVAGDAGGEGTTEVQDETYNATNFNGDTSHGVSQDDFYDYSHIGDTDDDGKINVLDITAGMPKTDANGVVSVATAGTDYYAPGSTDVALADGGTGASLSDPNADRIMFWDDSAGAVTWLTAGSGLTITATEITASGIGDVTKAGDCESGDCYDGSSDGGTYIRLYDGDSHYTSIASSNVSSNTAIVLPATAGTLLVEVGDTNIADGAVDGGTGGEIADNSVTAADLAATLTFADGDFVDLSGITHTGSADEGLALPTWADITPATNKKYLAASGNTLKLYNGGWVTFDPATLGAPTSAKYIVQAEDATLTEDYVITAGTGMDIAAVAPVGGTGGTMTMNFDSTEVGTTTWGSGSAVVWTFDASGGTDATITFGDNLVTVGHPLTVTGALTANSGIVMGTGDNITVNSNALLTSDKLNAEMVADDANLGDLSVASGVWSVTNDSHAHTSTTITLASTNLSDTTNIARLDADNTLTGTTNTVGNADADILAVQATLRGVGRAVSIDDDTTTSPTYATGTNDLFVEDIVEVGGTLYAGAINTGAGTDGSIGITLTTNTAFTPSGNQFYYINDAFYYSQAGTQKTPMRLEDAQTASGKKTFQGDIAVGDASNAGSIDIYDGSSNYLQIQVPSLSADYTIIQPTGPGVTGQYLKTTTSGTTATLSWDTPSASADTTGGTGGVQFNAAGVLTSDAGFVFTTASDKLALGSSGGSTTGTLDLYYTGTTYAATLTPNASMAADVTITMPSYTTTLLGSGANEFTGAITFSGAGSLSAAAATSSVPMVVGTATASGITAAGQTYFESDTEILTIGDGATAINLDMAPNVTYTFPAASSTLAALAAPVFTTSIEAPFLILGSAATAADAGAIRLPNAAYIIAEADAAGTDVSVIGVDSAEAIQVGGASATSVVITTDGGAVTIDGSVTAATSFIIGSADLNETDLEKLDGITNGTQAANKAVVADANVNIGAVKASSFYIGTSGSETQVTATAAEMNYLDIETLGTGVASKAVVLDGSGNYTAPAGTWDLDGATAVSLPNTTIEDGGVLTFDESAADPDDADIQLSATDGVFKIAAANGANNEDLTINLDATANTATISSSTGLTMITSGSIPLQGAVNVNTDANGMSSAEMTTAGMYGTFFVASGAGTWALPGAVSGMSFCVYSTTAAAVVINPDDADAITLNGTALSNGDSITSASGAGDFVCLLAVSDASWLTLGRSGTWTDTN